MTMRSSISTVHRLQKRSLVFSVKSSPVPPRPLQRFGQGEMLLQSTAETPEGTREFGTQLIVLRPFDWTGFLDAALTKSPGNIHLLLARSQGPQRKWKQGQGGRRRSRGAHSFTCIGPH